MSLSAPCSDSPSTRQIVQKHLQILGSVPSTAWEAYWQLCRDQNRFFSKSTLASIIHDLMVRVAQKVCSGTDDLDYREQYHGMHVVIVERKIVVRFKKLDENHRIANVDTAVQQQIDRGETSLFGDRIQDVVTIGYMPDATRTQCLGIWAVRHGRAGEPTWKTKIDDGKIIDHQIDDLFGVKKTKSAGQRDREEHAPLKLKPNVERRVKPFEQESKPQHGRNSP